MNLPLLQPAFPCENAGMTVSIHNAKKATPAFLSFAIVESSFVVRLRSRPEQRRTTPDNKTSKCRHRQPFISPSVLYSDRGGAYTSTDGDATVNSRESPAQPGFPRSSPSVLVPVSVYRHFTVAIAVGTPVTRWRPAMVVPTATSSSFTGCV